MRFEEKWLLSGTGTIVLLDANGPNGELTVGDEIRNFYLNAEALNSKSIEEILALAGWDKYYV